MSEAVNNIIGNRGESIAYVRLTQWIAGAPLFDAYILGEKHPTFDLIVYLLNSSGDFFFVQVKATHLGYTATEKRLNVSLEAKDVQSLASYAIPTYVLGVDDTVPEQTYIISINGENKTKMSNLCTQYPLDATNCQHLYDEVKKFWQRRKKRQPNLKSQFLDPNWR